MAFICFRVSCVRHQQKLSQPCLSVPSPYTLGPFLLCAPPIAQRRVRATLGARQRREGPMAGKSDTKAALMPISRFGYAAAILIEGHRFRTIKEEHLDKSHRRRAAFTCSYRDLVWSPFRQKPAQEAYDRCVACGLDEFSPS